MRSKLWWLWFRNFPFPRHHHVQISSGLFSQPLKSIRTLTRNCNPTFPVTHFPLVDINTGWAHPLALWQLELCQGDFPWCVNVSGGMAAHSSCRAVARAVSDVGRWGLERSRHSNSSHRCSVGFRSGLWAGQSTSGTLLSKNHSLTDIALWQEALSCWYNRHHRTGLLP
jgi:hypothetical protein